MEVLKTRTDITALFVFDFALLYGGTCSIPHTEKLN